MFRSPTDTQRATRLYFLSLVATISDRAYTTIFACSKFSTSFVVVVPCPTLLGYGRRNKTSRALFVAGRRVDKFIPDDAEVLFQKGAVGVCEFSQSVDIQLFRRLTEERPI